MRLLEFIGVLEGGAAMASAGVTRINKEDIEPTLDVVSKLFNIPRKDLHLLGSTGKSATSGDMDMAIDTNKYDFEAINNKVKHHFGDQFHWNNGGKIMSFAVPIAGDESKGKVQVDFMYVTDPKWAKFGHHSEGEKSPYKGIVRSILLRVIIGDINVPDKDYFEYDDNGQLIAKASNAFDPKTGIVRLHQHRPAKIRGGYKASMETISAHEFRKKFPRAKVSNQTLVTADPDKAAELAFGPGVKGKDLLTAERLIELVKQRYPKNKQDTIFKRAADALKRKSRDLNIPPEIARYIGK